MSESRNFARRIRFRGEVESRHDADDLLEATGDVVLVNRGRPRSLVFSCPDGCGTTLTINLDRRAGKAWRFYRGRRGISLYPSIWRDSGCKAHFILWDDRLLWCGVDHRERSEPEYDSSTEQEVFAAFVGRFRTVDEVASELEIVPWAVSRIAGRLAASGALTSKLSGEDRLYMKKPGSPQAPETKSTTLRRQQDPIATSNGFFEVIKKYWQRLMGS